MAKEAAAALVRAAALIGVAGCGLQASAQDLAASGKAQVTTTLAVEQALTEMRARPVLSNGLEATTRITPGLQLNLPAGRLRGALSYSAQLVHRAGPAATLGDEVLNALNASFVAEAVPNWAYVDARATVSQQSLSAFGRPAGDGTYGTANRAEVGTLSVSPYLRGPLGSLIDYEVRYTGSATRSRSTNAPESDTETALVTLGSPRRATLLGWSVTATRQRTAYVGASRSTTSDRAIATLVVNPDPELQILLNGGREGNDVGSVRRETFDNYGATVRWLPTPRTEVTLDAQERYFGRSHRVLLQHRMARSIWSYADTRDVTSGADTTGFGRPVTLYVLFDQLLLAQYPDATERDLRVRELIAAAGAKPDDVVAGGTLAGGITAQRRQDLSVALQGLRSTIALRAFRTDSRRIDDAAAQQPAGLEPVEQSGYSGTLSHSLTPLTTISLLGSRTMTHATATRAGTDQKSASLGLTSRLGPRMSGMLRAGYTVFNSPTDPSRETTVAGSVSLQF